MTAIDPILKQLFDTMPGCWGCKDMHSRFLYANAEYARLIGLPNHLGAIGLTDFDMPCATAACARQFQKQDQQVLRHGKPLRILNIHPFAQGRWGAYLFTKSPWKDEAGQLAGTIFHGVDITSSPMQELGSLLHKALFAGPPSSPNDSSFVIDRHFNPLSLSVRESEVLFFLLRAKRIKQISTILAISDRTVEHHLGRLKGKFFACNRNELIDRALENGYLQFIPQSLFSRQLSIVLE